MEPTTSGEPGGDGYLCPGVNSLIVRSRSFTDGDETWSNRRVGRVPDRTHGRVARPARPPGSRTGDSDGNRDVAHLADQVQSLLKVMPEAKWHQFEPVGRDTVRAGAKAAFGEYVDTIYHFDKADVVLALDAEFLAGMPGSLRYARDFIDRRR